jgi:MFS family permease
MVLSVPAGFCSAVTNVAARTVLLERAPVDARGQVIATQSTLANAMALVPTITVGLAIDLIAVRPVAFTIAVLLVIGAIAGRRIGIDQRMAEAPAMATPATNPKGRKR